MVCEQLDRETSSLLASLILEGRLVWRQHYSGGAVLEDIGGGAVVADLPAVNVAQRAEPSGVGSPR
jgi:hypothetical protein